MRIKRDEEEFRMRIKLLEEEDRKREEEKEAIRLEEE